MDRNEYSKIITRQQYNSVDTIFTETAASSAMPTAYNSQPQIKTYKSSPSKTCQKTYHSPSFAPSHLKSFISTAFSSDEEETTTASATTSFFSNNKLEPWVDSPNEIKTEYQSDNDNSFPIFKSKRKRSYSSSSSESISKKTFTFSAQSVSRKGPITGTYSRLTHSATVYKPRFPSDDSGKSSDSFSNKQFTGDTLDLPSEFKAGSLPQSPSSNIDEAPDPAPQSPPPTSPPLAKRCRAERSAAQKAHQLMKEFLPTQRPQKHNSCLDEEYTIEELPKYSLDQSLVRSLPPTLQLGYKLYSNIRNEKSLNRELIPFLHPVDSSLEDTKHYYQQIDKPMCLLKMEEKLANLDYYATPEIIADLRLIFENCYKFNGTEIWISKCASKIEMSLEQRITTLPYSVREKCTLQETSPHLTLYRDVCGRRSRTPRIFTGSTKTPIMLAMEELQLYKQRELKEIQTQVSRRQEEKLQENTILLCSHVADNPHFHTICSSFELVSSCVMICVCQEAFDISFTVLDLELGLLYPQYSEYMAELMLNLACNRKAVREIRKEAPGGKVSYGAWNKAVSGKLTFMYSRRKMYGRDKAETMGIHPMLFDVLGDSETGQSPVKDLLFHELSISQRLAIIYTLCHHKLEVQPSLTNVFTEYDPDSLRRQILGCDLLNHTYFYVPVWPEDIRVYVELPGTNEIKCVCRSVDDVERAIEQLSDTGTLYTLIGKEGGNNKVSHKKKKTEILVNLINELHTLYNAHIEHKAHYLLVESTVYKRLATTILEKGGNLEPAKCPSTPQPDKVIIDIEDNSSEENMTKSDNTTED